MDTFLSQLSNALNSWVKLTGIEPDQDKDKAVRTVTRHSFDVEKSHKRFQRALNIDPSGLTCALLFKNKATEYLQEIVISAYDILNDKDGGVTRELEHSRIILNFIQSEECTAKTEELRAKLSKALTHYGVDRKDVDESVNSPALAELWFNAQDSMTNLRLLKFMDGEASDAPPKYNKQIFGFRDVNALLGAMWGHPESGITLNLIEEKEVHTSYFTFAVRNGGKLFLLTDRNKATHPLQKHMSRCPGREMSKRVNQFWFPYELMGLNWHDKGRHISRGDGQEGLIKANTTGTFLSEMKDLKDSRTLIWTVAMLSLIGDQIWSGKLDTEELSYTGVQAVEAFKVSTTSKASIDTSSLPVPVAPSTAPLPLLKDLGKVLAEEQPKAASCGVNKWLEDRYASLITDVDIYPAVIGDDPTHCGALAPGAFGSIKELRDDQLFMGRHRQAWLVSKHADEEYKREHERVDSWFRDKLQSNAEILFSAAAQGEFVVPVPSDANRHWRSRSGRLAPTEENICFIYRYNEPLVSNYNAFTLGGYDRRGGKPRCYKSDSGASFKAVFRPRTAETLAILCGCKIKDLPDVLQNWQRSKDYRGNSILDRIDPMDWVFKDPWTKFNTEIVVYMGVRAMTKARKALGLPKYVHKSV